MNANKEMVLVEWRDARFFSGTYDEKTIMNYKMALFNRDCSEKK